MTSQLPQGHRHVFDFLPAYINGTLDYHNIERVRTHLLHCERCQLALASWEGIQGATQYTSAAEPLPRLATLEAVWAKIDASTQEQKMSRWLSPGNILLHLWLVFRRQIPLIHKSIWIASLLVTSAACIIALAVSATVHDRAFEAEWILALFVSIVTAVGASFIYGVENDSGFEITLATPTSIRIVMLCRTILVVGYNILLSALASIVIATVHGGGFWEIMQLWLGPMLLLASISVTLSIVLGSTLAVATSLIVEATQALPIYFGKNTFVVELTQSSFWQTNLPVLLLAVLFLAFSVFYAPRQPRLSN